MKENGKFRAMLSVCLFLIFLSVVFVLGKNISAPQGRSVDSLRDVQSGWYYLKDGEKVSVTIPATVSVEPGEDLTLYYDGLVLDKADATLITRGALYHLRIAVDGTEIFCYEDENFERNLQMSLKIDCRALLAAGIHNEKIDLALTYTAPQNGQIDISDVYVGSSEAVLRYQLWEAAPVFLIVFGMLLLGGASLIIYLYLRYKRIPESRFASAAMFLFLCGIWCLTDSSLCQYFFRYAPAVSFLSFYAFMLFPVPMIRFVSDTGDMKKYKSIEGLILLFYLNVIAQSLLQYLADIPMIAMLPVTHVLMGGGCVWLFALLWREEQKNPSADVRQVLIAFGLLGAVGVLSILLYWALGITRYDLIFQAGTIIFMAINMAGIGMKTVDNMRFRTEAKIYERLSKEDQLTGMPNRKAYEAVLNEMETEACGWKDAVLVYLSLRRLKDMNDSFGQGMGDELIIIAARCIERAYGSLGHCFRIDGAEFCVVLPDPEWTDAKLSERLDEELKEYNRYGDHRLSLARGFARLKDEHGMRRSISDWKALADRNLQKDRGWYRRERGE